MKNSAYGIVQENLFLKFEFIIRNLELEEVWRPSPDDLEFENRQLRHLLDWVKKYEDKFDLNPGGYWHLDSSSG